jgi:hypothetical protein
MNRSSVHLLDLPNEMLFNILNKLDNVDVLYSLLGINNERLDSITRQKTFSNILILHQLFITLLVSMERILLATHYPNLTELQLFNFQRDSSLHYFTGKQVSTERSQYNDIE